MAKEILLPKPKERGETSIEEALAKRRSVRSYRDAHLKLSEISQLLWAAQGVTDGYRTAPSAGTLYPLEIYLLSEHIDGLEEGIYKYDPGNHALKKVSDQNRQMELFGASLSQECVKEGAAVIVIAAVYERTTVKYGERGIRYVYMEVGSVAQNIYLQAATLGLGTVFVGAFYDEDVKRIIMMDKNEHPLAIMPIGRK